MPRIAVASVPVETGSTYPEPHAGRMGRREFRALGYAAGFRAGDRDGHHLWNRSDRPARYLVIGTRAPGDICTYSDVDPGWHAAGNRFTRRDGTPLAPEETA